MSRPARALLDAAALRHNLAEVRRRAPRSRVMAVIKANGYGHGVAWVAGTLDGADTFGVASVEEGVALRDAGIAKPICVLEGFFEPSELPLFDRHQLSSVVHHEAQLRALETAQLTRPIAIWIKLDTGMHRLGFSPDRFTSVWERLKSNKNVGELRVLSHFANADERNDPMTSEQLKIFRTASAHGGLEASIANSAGVLAWADAHLDWVRPGIMLYGGSPIAGTSAQSLDLRPVMTLQTQLIAVDARKKGDPIGYSGEYHCPEDMPVGVAAIGYGDGYPRRMPAGTPVLLNGKRVPIVGRVSMDMITLDLRSQPQAKPGDTVVLWGNGLPADEIAERAGTVSYELFCQVTPRVPRIPVGSK
jgi:alanine racemase